VLLPSASPSSLPSPDDQLGAVRSMLPCGLADPLRQYQDCPSTGPAAKPITFGILTDCAKAKPRPTLPGMASALQEAVNGRAGWSISGENAASYAPGGEWSALIRLTTNPNRRLGDVWHIALLRGGAAYQTRFACTLAQAVHLAERLVNG
jgi:hypothetical protein